MSDKEKFCIIITSCNDNKIKDKIVNRLLNDKLSACIQVSAAQSSYIFEDKINHDNEIIIKIKSKLSLYKNIENIIKELHDYKVPQIIAIPIIAISDDYSNWLKESLCN